MFQSLAQNESIKNRESQKLLKSILFQKLLIELNFCYIKKRIDQQFFHLTWYVISAELLCSAEMI